MAGSSRAGFTLFRWYLPALKSHGVFQLKRSTESTDAVARLEKVSNDISRLPWESLHVAQLAQEVRCLWIACVPSPTLSSGVYPFQHPNDPLQVWCEA